MTAVRVPVKGVRPVLGDEPPLFTNLPRKGFFSDGMYVISRAFGLPGLPESEREWFDPPGVLSLIVEALFVALYLWRATQATPERR